MSLTNYYRLGMYILWIDDGEATGKTREGMFPDTACNLPGVDGLVVGGGAEMVNTPTLHTQRMPEWSACVAWYPLGT